MRIEEIQKAIKELSPNELVLFRKWFLAFETKQSTREEDLKKLHNGVYFLKYSEVEKSEVIVIKKH